MSTFNEIKSWLDLHIKQNGQKLITGIIGNEAYTKVLNYAKSIADKIGVANGIAELDSEGLLKASQRPPGSADENVKVGAAGTADYLNDTYFNQDANHIRPKIPQGKIWQGDENGIGQPVDPPTGDVTRHRANPTISANVLTLDFNSKNELIAKKSTGGGIDVAADFSFAFSNVTNAEFAQVFLNLSAAVTITLPASTITASPLELEAGKYQAVFTYDGSDWHFVISEPEVVPS